MINFLKILIFFLPFSFVIGPLVLEIILFFLSCYFVLKIISEKDFSYFNNFYFKWIFLFSLYLLFSMAIFKRFDIGLNYSLFYIRYGIYILAVSYLVNNFNLKRTILVSFLILNSILILDSIYQFYSGSNFVGIKIVEEGRASSFFGSELILGSFILKISPFVFSLFFLFEKDKDKIKYIVPIFFFLNLMVILISGERSALFLYIFYSIYLLIFLKINKQIKIFFCALGIALSLLIIFNNKNIYERVVNNTIFDIIGKNAFTENYFNENELIVKDYNQKKCNDRTNNESIEDCKSNLKFYFFSPAHHNYYLTSINIFLDNKVFGSGPKSFRNLCKDEKYLINDWSCSNHTHNYYIQLLSETGIVGFLFMLFFYLTFVKILFKNIASKNMNIYSKNFNVVMIGAILINFFPFVPTGNFFNNWISILSYLPIIYLVNARN